jgi:hypothetical protein
MVAMLAGCGIACGADSPERTSPIDSNAACMDRTVDSSSGNCVVKDEGRPRRTYPPRQPAAKPPTHPAGSTSAAGNSGTGGK